MAGGVDGVTLPLLMPDFDERMTGLARNGAARRPDHGCLLQARNGPG
jgi:hypothetical protein